MSRIRRPNILFLLSDQHKAAVLGCEHHPDVATPNLDRLAANGAHLTRAYCQDAICVPSRCSIFSGLYPRTLGVLDNGGRSHVLDEVVSMPKAFKRAGYRTAAFGKRHLRGACDGGWDVAVSHMHEESPGNSYVEWVGERGLGRAFAHDWAAEFGRGPAGSAEHGREISFALMGTRESELPEGTTMEAFTASKTMEFLRECADTDEPFFCLASFYRPHQPYTPLAKYWRRHDRSRWGAGTNHGDAIARPPTLGQAIETLPPMFQEQFRGENRVWRLDLAREDEQHYRDYVSAYYALVEEIDDHIGDIMATLEDLKMLDDTIVIYTSDHGDFVGAHGMVEKCALGHNVYEDTIRVPLIVQWPQRVPPQTHDSLVELVDLYPTLLDLCDIPQPQTNQPLQGRSLASALTGADNAAARPFIVTENWTQATVVTPIHKLGVWIDPGADYDRDFRAQFPDMLFDRTGDPEETVNLTGDKRYADIETTLRNHLHEWMSRVPDAGRAEVVRARNEKEEPPR